MKPDYCVIGAGVFGAWTAWHLRQLGHSVVLADAWGPAHSRASSGGETRIIRAGYGHDAIYTRMAMNSLAQWKALFARTGQPLLHQTGALWMARTSDRYSAATEETFRAEGVPFEILSMADLEHHYPQFRPPAKDTYGIFEPEAGALMARRAVNAVVDDAIRAGVEYSRLAIDPLRPAVDAGVYIYACGPWLPKLFPTILKPRIFVTRQEVFFFATPPGDDRFSPARMPVWLDFTDPRTPYGFPDLENRGVKLAFDLHGKPFDPDAGDRTVSSQSTAAARQFLGERFPALRDAPLTETRVCQYSNSSNGDFLIDRHAERDRVWFIGCGSGHGFKHGPAIGEYAAQVITGARAPEPRFSYATKAQTQRRTVR
jgi:glycine/D-amino acid oxidase-like deaminating enzyme